MITEMTSLAEVKAEAHKRYLYWPTADLERAMTEARFKGNPDRALEVAMMALELGERPKDPAGEPANH